jgi:hypothetical protein
VVYEDCALAFQAKEVSSTLTGRSNMNEDDYLYPIPTIGNTVFRYRKSFYEILFPYVLNMTPKEYADAVDLTVILQMTREDFISKIWWDKKIPSKQEGPTVEQVEYQLALIERFNEHQLEFLGAPSFTMKEGDVKELWLKFLNSRLRTMIDNSLNGQETGWGPYDEMAG